MKTMLHSFGIIRNGDAESGVAEVRGRRHRLVDEAGERADSISCLETDHDCVVRNKLDLTALWVLIRADDGQ